MPALLVALFVVIGMPALFLLVPGAGMFLLLVPIWVVATAAIVAAAYFSGGSKGVFGVGGVAVAVAALAVLGPGLGEAGRCGAFPAELKPAQARPARIVFDGVATMVSYGEGEHHPFDMTAVLTGAEVIEIERLARGHIGEAWSMQAGPRNYCAYGRTAIRVGSNQGQGKEDNLDICLTRTKLLDYQTRQTRTLNLGDQAPTVYFVANPDVGPGTRNCDVLNIFERVGGAERKLGRIIMDWRNWKPRPDPRKETARGIPEHWLLATIRTVLGDQISEDALKPHLVR